MFIKSCGKNDKHPAHEYTHQWKKAELPFLHNPEEYPDTWDSQYRCQGVFVFAWTVVYMHPDCALCEECAELAVHRAEDSGSSGATEKTLVPVHYPAGTFAEVGHQATVKLI